MNNIRIAGIVGRESFQSGPQSPNFFIFGLIFDRNTIKIRKNESIRLANVSATFFWPAMKSETKALDVRKDFLQMSLTKYVGKTLLTPFRQARMG